MWGRGKYIIDLDMATGENQGDDFII
jgi:hypothetical protein